MNEMEDVYSREKVIVRTSVIGIIANVFLASFKAFVGFLSNSIAIILDAVNNMSDMVSSIITIIGTKLAGKAPSKKHPMGYGRIEYLSAMLVSAIVLYAGIMSLIESVKKLISPAEPEHTSFSFIVMGVAVLVKLVLGTYVKKKGVEVNSGSLIASGSDALFDSIISGSVLICAVIFVITGVNLEAYVGLLISVIIIKAGVEMLMDSIDEIIGKRIDFETVTSIKQAVCEEEQVHGAFDLDIHNYGPDTYLGSIHVEVDDTMSAGEIDGMIRRIQSRVYKKTGIYLESVTIYAVNTQNPEIIKMKEKVREIVLGHEGANSLHGFYVDMENHIIRFDYVTSFDNANKDELYESICQAIKNEYPEYDLIVARDYDIS